MTTKANIKINQKTAASTATNTTSKGLIMTAGFTAAVIGLWTAACFIGAVINSGPMGMIQGWFASVSGL